ncbi:MAG TPA: MlaD family protein [Candidatus Baltobacteraceae bacterium]
MAALAVLIIAGVSFYTVTKISRSNAYEFGVHFPTAAGIGPGGQVFLSGVSIGTVTAVDILPDTSVDVIINVVNGTDIPRTAKFSVQTSLTGSPGVAITVPKARAVANAVPAALPPDQVWPKRVLPVAEQPYGSPPLSLEIFMRSARTLGDRANSVLSEARPYGKQLAYHLQNARANGAATAAEMRGTAPALLSTVQSTIARAKRNVQSAQVALRERDQPKIDELARSFTGTVADMRRTAAALQQLKRDPRLRVNVQAASAQIKTVTANLAALSRDMQMIAGNPQTKAQLHDAAARFRDILHHL